MRRRMSFTTVACFAQGTTVACFCSGDHGRVFLLRGPRSRVLLRGHGSPLLTRHRRTAGCTNCSVPAQVPDFGWGLEASRVSVR